MPTMPNRTNQPRPKTCHRLGAHVSVAGGLHNAFGIGAELGCQCLQVFVKNQRQWSARPLGDPDIRQWRSAARRTGIRTVVGHATYLVNLARGEGRLRRMSIATFIDELDRCDRLGIRGLVIHPGSHGGDGYDKGIGRVIEAIDQIHQSLPRCRARILLETTAGQGSSLGHRFEEIGEIIHRVAEPARLGVCLDTCHVFAAGYDITTPRGYADAIAQFDRLIGLRKLACLHLNDSARPLGSRVDRHAHIGEGHLGRRAFALIMRDRRLVRVPKIIETPKEHAPDGRHYDVVNLELLRGLAGRGLR